jgi:hypothetical protein
MPRILASGLFLLAVLAFLFALAIRRTSFTGSDAWRASWRRGVFALFLEQIAQRGAVAQELEFLGGELARFLLLRLGLLARALLHIAGTRSALD